MPWTFYNSNGQRLSTATTLIDNLNIDGATAIGAAIADDDLFIIDDGAGGTNRKTEASRLKTYVGSAVTRIAGDTGEATTTSTGDTDLLTIGSLSVPVTTPLHYILDCRKSTGYADDARAGLKINATKIGGRTLWETGANNEAQSGVAHGIMGSRVTNYFAGMSLGIGAAYKTDLTRRQVSIYPNQNDSNAQPDATCTSWIVVGSVANSGITLGVDEVHLYTMAVS